MTMFRVDRVWQSESETLGIIRGMPCPPLVCLERPWANNAIGLSRIKSGIYDFAKWHSPTFKREVLRLDDEQLAPRSAILFHPANWVAQLKGCFAPGMDYRYWGADGWGVASSGKALDILMDAMPARGQVEVVDAFLG